MREFITGNEAVVRGAMRSGCDFFAGYPITPASSILSKMLTTLGGRGVAVQTEDEIAAIGQCIGAAMAGARAMTASSGPGLSLYSENIGLAQMMETPLVVVISQRMGPATGGATTTGEGDVYFARFVTSGGYPIPVLAATCAASAYRLTCRAFNIAEILRTPVILLLSKDISMTRQRVDLDTIETPPLVHRHMAEDTDAPYAVATPQDIPAFAPLGGPRCVRATGSIHDQDGLLTTDRLEITRKLRHLRDKIENRADWLADTRHDHEAEATTLIVSYGLADGAARAAVSALRSRNVPVSHLTLYTLWPAPRRAIRQAIGARTSRILVPELNIGFYVEEIRRAVPGFEVESIARYDGGLIDPDMIINRICDPSTVAPAGAQPCPC